MTTKKKNLSASIGADTDAQLRQFCEDEDRSLSNGVDVLLKVALKLKQKQKKNGK